MIQLTKHVQIIPSACIRLGGVVHGLVQNVHDGAVVTGRLAVKAIEFSTWTVHVHAVPGVGQVTAGAPGVGHGRGKVPGAVDTPVAQRVEDRTAGGIERLAHGVVAVKRQLRGTLLALVVAVVVFEVVNLLICERESTQGEREKTKHTPQLAHAAASFSS